MTAVRPPGRATLAIPCLPDGFVHLGRATARIDGLFVVRVAPAPRGRRETANTTVETTSPMAPTTMRMTPTVENRNPWPHARSPPEAKSPAPPDDREGNAEVAAEWVRTWDRMSRTSVRGQCAYPVDPPNPSRLQVCNMALDSFATSPPVAADA